MRSVLRVRAVVARGIVAPSLAFLLALGLMLLTVGHGSSSREPSPTPHRELADVTAYAPLMESKEGLAPWRPSVSFVENRGQWDAPAGFIARVSGMQVLVEASALSLQVEDPATGSGHVLRLELEGSSPRATLQGVDRQSGVNHFILGRDEGRWQRDIPAYGQVLVAGVHDGIDLVVREQSQARGHVAYDIHVAAGADPTGVVMVGHGADSLRIVEDGSLVMETPPGPLVQSEPVAWEVGSDGSRRPLACAFRLLGGQRYGFSVEGRNPSLPMVIDPGLAWSTYFGGSLVDHAWDMTRGPKGQVVLAGDTVSPDLPVVAGSYQQIFDPVGFPARDAFLTVFDRDTGLMVYSTFFGGASSDEAHAVCFASDGSLVFGGQTGSLVGGLPVTPSAFDQTQGGFIDAFIARLTPDGAGLCFSTYLGGDTSGIEIVRSLELASNDDVIALLRVGATDFPTTPGAFDTIFNGGNEDAAVSRLSADGSQLVYSTYIGSSSTDRPEDLVLSANDEPIIVGGAGVADFPWTTVFGPGPSPGSSFITCLSVDGSSLVFSTALVGSVGFGVALGPTGDIYVVGQTVDEPNFPTTPGSLAPFQFSILGPDGYVARLDPTGTQLRYSTFLGGVGLDHAKTIRVDSSGAAIVGGGTGSHNFPTTPGAFDNVLNDLGPGTGNWDAFVVKLNPEGSALQYATFLGGPENDALSFGGQERVVLGSNGSVILCAHGKGDPFPITPGAFQPQPPGQVDITLTRLDMLPSGVTTFGEAASVASANPLVAGLHGIPGAGLSSTITCLQAPPSSHSGLMFLSADRLTQPVSIQGAELWIDPLALVTVHGVASDEMGSSASTVRVPGTPGVQGYVQYVWPDPEGSGLWMSSNALEIVIQ